jgi:hypothetical protein
MSPIADPRYAEQRRAAAAQEEALAQRSARMEYIKPLGLLALGGAIVMTSLALSEGSEERSGPMIAALYPVGLAFELVFGMVGLWLATKVLIDDAGPLPLALLRLAGVYACTDAVALMAAPLLGIGWLIKLAVYLGLLMWLFDLDTTESVLLAVITFVRAQNCSRFPHDAHDPGNLTRDHRA